MALKENQTIKPVFDMGNQTITLEWRNRTPVRIDMSKIHQDNLKRAAYVGMAQVRLVDAAAIGRVDSKGNVIPEHVRDQMKYDRVLALRDHYESGSDQWSPARSNEPKGTEPGLIREALVRCGAKPEMVAALDKDAIIKLSKAQKVAEMILTIKAERLVPVVDADSELDKLLAQ